MTSSQRIWISALLLLLLLGACGLAGPAGMGADPYGTGGGLFGGLLKPTACTECAYLTWPGSDSEQDVLDADGEILRFTADAPHFLIYERNTAFELEVTPEGYFLQAGAVIGMVALQPDADGRTIAVLVDEDGVPYDVNLEANDITLR